MRLEFHPPPCPHQHTPLPNNRPISIMIYRLEGNYCRVMCSLLTNLLLLASKNIIDLPKIPPKTILQSHMCQTI